MNVSGAIIRAMSCQFAAPSPFVRRIMKSVTKKSFVYATNTHQQKRAAWNEPKERHGYQKWVVPLNLVGI